MLIVKDHIDESLEQVLQGQKSGSSSLIEAVNINSAQTKAKKRQWQKTSNLGGT